MLVWFVFILAAAAEARTIPSRQTSVSGKLSIVGGTDAAIEDFPSQASLRNSGNHVCGCVLLSTTLVLTVAHCVDGVSIWEYDVYYGSASRLTGGTVAPATAYSMHPLYDPFEDGEPNDIATVDAAIFFDGVTSAPAPMPSGNDNFEGDMCTITGWGQTSGSSSSLPEILQRVDIQVMDNLDCLAMLIEENNAAILDGHVCTFDSDDQNSGACDGDDGGPLFCSEAQGQVLGGLMSWTVFSLGNCDINFPSVYTSVIYYMDWIEEQTAN